MYKLQLILWKLALSYIKWYVDYYQIHSLST